MQLSREQVAHVAWLARLSLSETELEQYAQQLNSILDHVGQLREIDVTGIEPTAMAAETNRNVVRPDEPRPALDQEQVTANAADVEAGYFRVRAILEETA